MKLSNSFPPLANCKSIIHILLHTFLRHQRLPKCTKMWRHLLLLLLSLVLEAARGEIVTFEYLVKPRSSATPPGPPLIESFGMAPGGRLHLSVTKTSGVGYAYDDCPVFVLLLSLSNALGELV